jgi:hypothetical protein
MRQRSFGLLVGLVLISGVASPAYSSSHDWIPLATGIDFKEFRLVGPNQAYVARMERANPSAIIESSIAKGYIYGGRETVSGMVQRYDGAINSWGREWGNTNEVVVAINGSYFDLDTGVPESGVIHSGSYAKRFDDLGGGSGFIWRMDRSAHIGQCVDHPPERQLLTLIESSQEMEIAGINVRPRTDELVMFTPEGSPWTLGGSDVEVLVELLSAPAILFPPRMSIGVVREIREGSGGTIPFGHVVLAARGQARDILRSSLRLGSQIGIASEIIPLQEDCRTRDPTTEWAASYASISGNYLFLKDGKPERIDDQGAIERHPRTAICMNDEYIYFVVVDGRDPGRSVGMTMDELARFCRDQLLATWGINQDGGGSSAMWVNGEILNVPSDGNERTVANGLMMVVVQPMRRSGAFLPGNRVQTISLADLRLGPGMNYRGIADIAPGEEGIILPDTSNVNGVFARGTYWWKVKFRGLTGWVDESTIEKDKSWFGHF